MLHKTIIRAFDGSLADAKGLLAVEKATFDEVSYSAEQVRDMLSGGTQRAWLAIGQGQVIGFVIAFLTTSLRGPCWEIDLLAVQSDETGRGLGTRLIRKAASGGMALTRRTRAVISTDNIASARAFGRAGYRRDGLCDLLIFRPQADIPQPWTPLGVTIRGAEGVGAVAQWLPEDVVSQASGGSGANQPEESPALLVAEHLGKPAGYAELIPVQTLLYEGLWIESLAASSEIVRSALIHNAVNRAAAAGLDEVGMMAPGQDLTLRQALRAAGFRSLGEFDWFRAGLPLPGLASSRMDGGEVGVGHV